MVAVSFLHKFDDLPGQPRAHMACVLAVGQAIAWKDVTYRVDSVTVNLTIGTTITVIVKTSLALGEG